MVAWIELYPNVVILTVRQRSDNFEGLSSPCNPHCRGDDEGLPRCTKGDWVSVAKPTKKTASKSKPKPAAKAARVTAKKPAPVKSKPAAKAVAAPKSGKIQIKVVSKPAAKLAKGAPAKLSNSAKSNGKAKRPAPVEVAPPAPVLKAKPGKNLAGLSTKELDTFRELLLQKRRELVGDMYSMEREALQRSGENLSNLPIHMADMGTDNYEQEFTLGLMEKDRNLLREINSALMKIQSGTYGICEGTGKPISKARLEVQPWAKYSIEHARKLENRGVR